MTRQTRDPYQSSSSTVGALSCAGRLIVFFFAVTILFVALFFAYRRWQTADSNAIIALGEGTDDLSAAERFLLQNQLSAQRDALLDASGRGRDPVTFTVRSGETASIIADNLATVGLLREENRSLFLEYVRFYGLDAGLHAGQFTLDPRENIPQLVDRLTGSALNDEITLNFLSGWRAEEMAAYLDATRPADIDATAFLDIVYRRAPVDIGRYAFLSSLPADASLEGYLFPDSYTVAADADAADLVTLMLDRFDATVTPALRQQFGEQGLTVRDAVIIASIVQREAPVPAERPTVASVFLNRIEQEMRLDADPTVQYAVGYHGPTNSWWKVPLSAADLQIESPYNTYRTTELPPGPIANPSLTALEAVANPADTDYLFFFASCAPAERGTHLFSLTYEEHLANVQACR